ncbi:SH3 and multiple ankyrin repeat domains protein 3-like [Pollicipes pollicipes]|uniref:SH3 and multiple ankyrin repeat domains protein 3-like n=1 Tax=Pollicipes pollicipes TaxID=41117 RepID=UPI0018851092|nr:SH3 and multiple ankyrin repeat domains protein 3-like [Pollicipes pollicipes]
MEDDLSVTSDELIFIRISVPELSVEKCLQFGRNELVWDIKQQCLSSLPKELKESFNYGLFYPPQNGKAGKFLDEARPIADYPFSEPVGYLELKYKRRVYKMLKLDERQLKAAHSRASLRRLLEHVAAGHADKVAKLCAKGLDSNFHCAETGETPLTLTAKLKSPSRVILTLVNGGAIVDYRTLDGATALHKAVQRNNFEALKTLLDLGASPNYQDAKGLTPLYYSILHNANAIITQALLHDHATIGARDCQGWAEVHQAARRSMTQHLEHLLFYGADMNAQNASGNTPLHVCAINGEEACARVLLFRGADRDALNFANQTPYQVAVIAGNLELAEVIQRHSPDDVVPFKEAPKYNPRRRSGIVLPRTHSESRLSSPLSKPPSPSPSNRSLPPFSSASSLSEASTGSSGTCTQPTSEAEPTLLHGKDMFDVVSESSGVGTSNGSGSGESCDTNPETGILLPGAGTTVVCMEAYSSSLPGHLSIMQGDIIEVSASTDNGLVEGCLAGQLGLFPARCVQEVRLRKAAPAGMPPPPPPAPPAESPYGRLELSTPYGTTPRHRRSPLQPRTVVLHRSAKGFGFVLRGAKSSSPLMELRPSERCPALQYLDDVDPGGVAERAGLHKWDFILAINGVDVSQASHELVVEQIRRAGDLVAMTVVSLPESGQSVGTTRSVSTLPRKLSASSVGGRPPIPPLPPKRDPKTTLSVGRARARSMFNSYPEIEALDRAIHDYDSEGRSTNSSSVDSETYKVPNVKVASIRTRPTSSRLSSRELEEMFARQGSAPRYPPTAGQGGPRVYASVAEMKRHKGKKPKGAPLESVYVGDTGSLRKEFHSTPDLQNAATWLEQRRSHSQEDLHALQHGPGARLGPHAAWSSTEHLYSRARRTSAETGSESGEGRGGYAVPPPLGDGESRRVPSTFRPSADAKLYASPVELKSLSPTAAAAPLGGSSLQSMLAEKVAARRRRLSVGDAGSVATHDPSPADAEDRVEQVTRIQVGKKSQASGIPSPSKGPSPGMTKSHTIGSLSGDDLRVARSKLRSAKPPAAATSYPPEEADNSSSGVSSDQDQAQPKYVTFIPTEGAPYTRRQDESEESESSDDTSDRTWILSSERARQAGQLARPAGAAEPRKSSSIPCLLSAKSGAAKPVSITVPGGRPARDGRHLRFGGTTTVVITSGSSPEPEPLAEQSIERSLQQIEQHASQLGGGSSNAAPVVPPPPGFDGGGLLLAPPPEFSDPAADAGARPPAPRPPPKPVAAADAGSRLVKPKTLGLRGRSPSSPGTTSPTGVASPAGMTSPTGMTSPAGATAPRSSGIPRSVAATAGGRRTSPAGSPSKIPGAVRARPTSLPQPAAPAHVKNRFRGMAVAQWTVEDTCDWLESLFMSEYKARFAEAAVDGPQLLQLDGPGFAELGVKRMGHRMNIEKSLKRLSVQARSPAR